MIPINRFWRRILGGVLVWGSLGTAGCTVALQHIPAADSAAAVWTPAGFHAPYASVYASTTDALNKVYGSAHGLYKTGVVGTDWYNYKYRSYPWGVTRYRYRILVNITNMQAAHGYGIDVRVPVQKESGRHWKYVGRDSKIEARVKEDVKLWIMKTNYNIVEISRKKGK